MAAALFVIEAAWTIRITPIAPSLIVMAAALFMIMAAALFVIGAAWAIRTTSIAPSFLGKMPEVVPGCIEAMREPLV